MRSSFFMGYFAAEMLAGPSRPEGSSGESVVPDENNPARIATRYNMWRYQRIRPPRKCGRECTPPSGRAFSAATLAWLGGFRRRACLRISPADTIDAVDVIASRLRHLHYLRQVVLGATLTILARRFHL